MYILYLSTQARNSTTARRAAALMTVPPSLPTFGRRLIIFTLSAFSQAAGPTEPNLRVIVLGYLAFNRSE